MSLLFADNALTTLSLSINGSVTSIVVSDVSKFPSITNVGTDNFHIVVVSLTDYEEMIVTAVDSVAKTFTVVRSSSPKIFPAGSYVGLYNTSAVMSLIQSMAGASSTLTRAVVSVDLSGSANQLVGDEIINFTFSSDFAIKNSGKNWTRSTSAITFRGFYYLNQTTVLASTDSGIYRSTDSGVTWSVLSAACKSACPIIDVPNDSATGGKRLLSFDNSNPPILYYSNNSGDTWGTITFTTDTGILSYVRYIINLNDSTTNPTLLVMTNSGIYKSTDNGATWARKNSSAISAGSSNIIKVGNAVFSTSGAGIYKSTNSGESWALVSGTSAGAFASITQIDTAGQKLLALKSSGSGGIISTNGGITWTSINDSLITANYFRSCLFTGTSILAGSAAGTVYISLDGLSWATTDLTSSTSVNAFLLASDYVLAGTNIGTYKSTDKSSFSITLPDQLPQYVSTTISFSPPAGYVALNSAQLLQSLIVTSRPTYNASIVTNAAGNTVLQIDTNSASNIIGGTILVSTNSFAGSLSLSTTDGGVTTSASTISIVDNRPGVSGTYTYSAPSGATNAQICGDIAFGETLQGYWFSVSSSNTTRTRLILESIPIGLLSDAYKPQVTFTNPNTLSASVNIVATGTGSSGTGNDQYVLPIANTTAIGGVKASPRPAGQFVTGINTANGSLTFDTPTAGSVNSVTGNIVNVTDPQNPVVNQKQSDWTATNGETFINNQPTISIGQNNFSKFSQITFSPNSFTASSGASFNTPQPVSVSLNPATINNLGGVIATSGGNNQFVNGVLSDGRLAYGSPINPPTPTRSVVAFDVTGEAAQTTGDEVLNFAFSSNFSPEIDCSQLSTLTTLYTASLFCTIDNVLLRTDAAGAVYRSIDNGTTWVASTGLPSSGAYLASFANPSQNIIIFVSSTTNGIYRSTDNGVSFSLTNQTSVNFTNVAFTGGNFYACPSIQVPGFGTNYIGIYRSTDGITWSATNQSTGNFQKFLSNGTYIIAASTVGIYRSTDGITWSLTGLTTGYIRSLAFIGGTNWVACGNGAVYKSSDNGATWSTVSGTTTTTYWYKLVKIGSQIISATSSGPRISSNGGTTWTNISTSVPVSSFENDIVIYNGSVVYLSVVTSGIVKSNSITNLSVTLPAHNSYPVQNLSLNNLALSDNATSTAAKLQTAILALRPTYTTNITGNATLVVDTNSTGNITDTTLIQNGLVTGTLALSITQGGAAGVLPSIVITDVRDGSTYQYSPSSGATNNQICNEISLGETLPNYWFYVSGSNSTKTRLTLESISTGSISTQLPTMTITNPNTLSSTRTIISPGS